MLARPALLTWAGRTTSPMLACNLCLLCSWIGLALSNRWYVGCSRTLVSSSSQGWGMADGHGIAVRFWICGFWTRH